MKTLGRILIILAVFALVMGITYGIVNADSSSVPGTTDRFEPGSGQPSFPREGREDRRERGGAEWLFEALRNIVIMGIIVALVVIPKSWMQKRKRTAQIVSG